MHRSIYLSCMALILVAGVGAAQESALKEAVSEIGKLDFLIGRWKLEIKNPEGDEQTTGELVFEKSIGNRYLIGAFKGDAPVRGDTPMEFLWLITFDMEAESYSSWFFYIFSDKPEAYVGKWTGGNTITFTTRDDVARKSRWIIGRRDDGTVYGSMESKFEDEDWRLTAEMSFTRQEF